MSGQSFEPLAGVRVLEFGQIVTARFCSLLLADFGADVVKVENSEGDDGMRQWPPPMQEHEGGERFSGNFASLNRNKRSLLARLRQAPFVPLAWVNGAAFGAGADIASACAFRLGTMRARFRFPGFQFGVALGTRRLAELVRHQHARQLLARNEEIDATRAQEWDLLTGVVDEPSFAARPSEFARLSAGVDAETLGTLLRITDAADHDADLADLVRSVARFGIHARVARCRQTGGG